MEKLLNVSRVVPKELRDSSNHPHVENVIYSVESASKQGFLASMVDDEHYLIVKLVNKK